MGFFDSLYKDLFVGLFDHRERAERRFREVIEQRRRGIPVALNRYMLTPCFTLDKNRNKIWEPLVEEDGVQMRCWGYYDGELNKWFEKFYVPEGCPGDAFRKHLSNVERFPGKFV